MSNADDLLRIAVSCRGYGNNILLPLLSCENQSHNCTYPGMPSSPLPLGEFMDDNRSISCTLLFFFWFWWWHYVLFCTVHCWDCGLYNILLHVPLSSSSPAEYRITYCWRSRRGCLMIEGSFWISAFEMPNGSRRRRHREWYCTRQEF